ncbi:Sister chromatid cohesion protein DCC1 [Entomortierella lignicola]|nr:Sister chromatid cohesion protein DCC1 [Entomortierella lignicola]
MSVTRVVESRVIEAPIDIVWTHVRTVELGFWTAVKSVQVEGGVSEVGSTRKISFKDGALQEVKIVELSDLSHTVSFDFIEAQPPVEFMSALHTITLHKVTANNTTFVEWSAEFSSDAQLAVIEDSRYKRQEGLEDLAKAVAKNFQVRGLESDTAVLCTSDKTFSLQRAHTSNTLMPIAPIIRQNLPGTDVDMDSDMDPFRNQYVESEDPNYESQTILDILDSVLDLIPISPRLDRLAELLGQSLFEGWAYESQHQRYLTTALRATECLLQGRLYTWAQLQSIVQASDKEILQWLNDKHACLIEGHWRLFKRRFIYEILQEILLTMNVLDMAADAVDGNVLCQTIEDSGSDNELGIERWMVEHCLKSFSEIEQTDSGLYRLSAKKLCTFMGTHILSSIERGSRWRLEDFMKKWEESLNGHFPTDLVYLAGECIVEEERGVDRGQVITYIRYFSKNNLPSDPAARFTALFEIKNKWDGQEIRPFLRDLVLDEKKLDILLLKHARSVKQPGGSVIYSSRVIK